MISWPPSVENWETADRSQLKSEIRAAIDQLKADEDYETEGSKVSETLMLLRNVSISATLLVQQLSTLSPVGVSAIHEASRKPGRKLMLNDVPFVTKPIFRADMRDAARFGLSLARACDMAIDIVKAGHMSDVQSGQGTGSSEGKESDLRAIGYADGFKTVPFKNPKDKFAVRVIEVLVKHEHPLMRSSSRLGLVFFLDHIWAEAGKSNSVNWTRVLRARAQIAKKVEREQARLSGIRLRSTARNAASLEK